MEAIAIKINAAVVKTLYGGKPFGHLQDWPCFPNQLLGKDPVVNIHIFSDLIFIRIIQLQTLE